MILKFSYCQQIQLKDRKPTILLSIVSTVLLPYPFCSSLILSIYLKRLNNFLKQLALQFLANITLKSIFSEFVGDYFQLQINTPGRYEYFQQQNYICGTDSTTVPMFIIMKDYVTKCNSVTNWCVLTFLGNNNGALWYRKIRLGCTNNTC